MLKHIVRVEYAGRDKVKIKFQRQAACSCCRASSVCGSGDHPVVIDNPGLTIKRDDKLEVGIDEKYSLQAAVLAFFIPSLMLVFLLTLQRGQDELRSFFLAVIPIFVYYLIIRLAVKRKRKNFTIKILRKI